MVVTDDDSYESCDQSRSTGRYIHSTPPILRCIKRYSIMCWRMTH